MENHAATSALARVFSGEAPEAEAEKIVVHLPGCRWCWERAARVVARLQDGRSRLPANSLARAALALLEGEKRQALRRLRARGWWSQLVKLDCKGQLDRLRGEPAVQTVEMFSTLIEAAACAGLDDPHVGEEMAQVAQEQARALPESEVPLPLREDLQAEALGIVANCRRLAGDWRGSASAFEAARGHNLQGTGEPAREARLLSLQASLATDVGRPEPALEMLARAATLYGNSGDFIAVAAISVQEAGTLVASSRYDEAIGRAEEALRSLPRTEARLELLARRIITESLALLGRPAEALRSLLASQPLFQRFWGRGSEMLAFHFQFSRPSCSTDSAMRGRRTRRFGTPSRPAWRRSNTRTAS